MADLALDADEIMRTAHLEDRQLFFLQCAMEENCLASAAYELQKQHPNHWHLETRRLLRFTLRALNAGSADFKPFIPKNLWEWHACHMWEHFFVPPFFPWNFLLNFRAFFLENFLLNVCAFFSMKLPFEFLHLFLWNFFWIFTPFFF